MLVKPPKHTGDHHPGLFVFRSLRVQVCSFIQYLIRMNHISCMSCNPQPQQEPSAFVLQVHRIFGGTAYRTISVINARSQTQEETIWERLHQNTAQLKVKLQSFRGSDSWDPRVSSPYQGSMLRMIQSPAFIFLTAFNLLYSRFTWFPDNSIRILKQGSERIMKDK